MSKFVSCITAIAVMALLPMSTTAQCTVFVNELHYDNAGADTGEFVEVAGVAGTDLSGWNIILYNGLDGKMYSTIPLSGVIDDEGLGSGAVEFPKAGIQNGNP